MNERDYLWKEASVLYDKGEYRMAIQVYNEMYEQFPDEHECLLKNGFCYIMLEEPKKVIEYFERYLEIDESAKKRQKKEIRWGILQNLGISYSLLSSKDENLKKAYKYFQKAIEIESKPESFLYLGEISNKLGEEDLAINYWKTAAKMSSGEAMMALNSRGIEI